MDFINECKRHAKWIKKHDNPGNLTLMQIQHHIAVCHGYQNWKDLLDKNKEKENGKKTTSKKESR